MKAFCPHCRAETAINQADVGKPIACLMCGRHFTYTQQPIEELVLAVEARPVPKAKPVVLPEYTVRRTREWSPFQWGLGIAFGFLVVNLIILIPILFFGCSCALLGGLMGRQ